MITMLSAENITIMVSYAVMEHTLFPDSLSCCLMAQKEDQRRGKATPKRDVASPESCKRISEGLTACHGIGRTL